MSVHQLFEKHDLAKVVDELGDAALDFVIDLASRNLDDRRVLEAAKESLEARRRKAKAIEVALIEEGDAIGRAIYEHLCDAFGITPLTDADLERKFSALAEPVLGGAALRPLMDAAWALASASDVQAMVRMAVPQA